MINTRLLFRTARRLRRDGFTLVELLVVIGIIAILAGVALGPITSGIEKAKENSGLQTARSINLLMFSYSNDNNQTYLPGSGSANPQSPAISTGHDIANALLNNKYATDATVFAISSSKKYTGATAPYALTAANLDFDFMGGASTSTGLTSSAPDQTPIVYTDLGGGSITGPSGTTAGSCTINSTAPFQLNGVAVAYKSNSAQFLKATTTGAGAAKVSNFISASFSDTWGSNYNAITP